jgi:predicted DNA binding protein
VYDGLTFGIRMTYLLDSCECGYPIMCVIVSAHIPPGQFALRDTLAGRPGAAFELVQHVAHGSGTLSLVWALVPDEEDVAAVVRDDATVADVDVLTTADGASLLRIEWEGSMRTIISDVVGAQGTLTSASATTAGWSLQFLFPSREGVTATNDACDRHGVDIELRSIRSFSGTRENRYGLTTSQHETMLTAHDLGYYNVPRGVTLADLASRMGVSHQTLSERLRRGHNSLVGNTLAGETSTAHVELK